LRISELTTREVRIERLLENGEGHERAVASGDTVFAIAVLVLVAFVFIG